MKREDVNSLLKLPLPELILIADKVRKDRVGARLELCSIMNAKSGLCSQNCKFCAQSMHHTTGIATYPLKSKEEMIEKAKRAKEIGAERFDIVTSGESLSRKEINKYYGKYGLIEATAIESENRGKPVEIENSTFKEGSTLFTSKDGGVPVQYDLSPYIE